MNKIRNYFCINALVFMLFGCTPGANNDMGSITGTWKVQEIEAANQDKELVVAIFMNLNREGIIAITDHEILMQNAFGKVSMRDEYTVNSNEISIVQENENVIFKYTLEGGILTLINDELKYRLEKI